MRVKGDKAVVHALEMGRKGDWNTALGSAPAGAPRFLVSHSLQRSHRDPEAASSNSASHNDPHGSLSLSSVVGDPFLAALIMSFLPSSADVRSLLVAASKPPRLLLVREFSSLSGVAPPSASIVHGIRQGDGRHSSAKAISLGGPKRRQGVICGPSDGDGGRAFCEAATKLREEESLGVEGSADSCEKENIVGEEPGEVGDRRGEPGRHGEETVVRGNGGGDGDHKQDNGCFERGEKIVALVDGRDAIWGDPEKRLLPRAYEGCSSEEDGVAERSDLDNEVLTDEGGSPCRTASTLVDSFTYGNQSLPPAVVAASYYELCRRHLDPCSIATVRRNLQLWNAHNVLAPEEDAHQPQQLGRSATVLWRQEKPSTASSDSRPFEEEGIQRDMAPDAEGGSGVPPGAYAPVGGERDRQHEGDGRRLIDDPSCHKRGQDDTESGFSSDLALSHLHSPGLGQEPRLLGRGLLPFRRREVAVAQWWRSFYFERVHGAFCHQCGAVIGEKPVPSSGLLNDSPAAGSPGSPHDSLSQISPARAEYLDPHMSSLPLNGTERVSIRQSETEGEERDQAPAPSFCRREDRRPLNSFLQKPETVAEQSRPSALGLVRDTVVLCGSCREIFYFRSPALMHVLNQIVRDVSSFVAGEGGRQGLPNRKRGREEHVEKMGVECVQGLCSSEQKSVPRQGDHQHGFATSPPSRGVRSGQREPTLDSISAGLLHHGGLLICSEEFEKLVSAHEDLVRALKHKVLKQLHTRLLAEVGFQFFHQTIAPVLTGTVLPDRSTTLTPVDCRLESLAPAPGELKDFALARCMNGAGRRMQFPVQVPPPWRDARPTRGTDGCSVLERGRRDGVNAGETSDSADCTMRSHAQPGSGGCDGEFSGEARGFEVTFRFGEKHRDDLQALLLRCFQRLAFRAAQPLRDWKPRSPLAEFTRRRGVVAATGGDARSREAGALRCRVQGERPGGGASGEQQNFHSSFVGMSQVTASRTSLLVLVKRYAGFEATLSGPGSRR